MRIAASLTTGARACAGYISPRSRARHHSRNGRPRLPRRRPVNFSPSKRITYASRRLLHFAFFRDALIRASYLLIVTLFRLMVPVIISVRWSAADVD